ncbi:hypothetical protein Salmuc_01213 [Salipiger mucosus DSM 16094]|uniref:Uncharacterized protein n=1 Tax=Salipiger mucosus DSM 16094 TaxID=1123237 RepID=S9QZD5_9RHOB|nr:hypothetical protein Salmuc_01213 [Salipiger mucosus DSM 16094]
MAPSGRRCGPLLRFVHVGPIRHLATLPDSPARPAMPGPLNQPE